LDSVEEEASAISSMPSAISEIDLMGKDPYVNSGGPSAVGYK